MDNKEGEKSLLLFSLIYNLLIITKMFFFFTIYIFNDNNNC